MVHALLENATCFHGAPVHIGDPKKIHSILDKQLYMVHVPPFV